VSAADAAREVLAQAGLSPIDDPADTIERPAPQPRFFDDYITVSVNSRHGRSSLHTFGSWADTPTQWFLATPPSAKQKAQLNKRASQGRHPSRTAQQFDTATDLRLRRPAGDVGYGDMLAQGARVDLGEGVSPQGSTLAVVFDALREAGRTEVDLADLKVVLSEVGSAITRLDTLPAEQQRVAQPALYLESVRRCTSV
jgi:hypothetical protein